MKKQFTAAAIIIWMASCSTGSTGIPGNLNTVQCQAYKVTIAGNDTTLLEDIDTYSMTDKTPQYYENWWGVKTYPAFYTYYKCWYK